MEKKEDEKIIIDSFTPVSDAIKDGKIKKKPEKKGAEDGGRDKD